MGPDSKPYRLQDHITTSAPQEVVMRRVLAPKTWPEWQAEIKAVEGPDQIQEGDQVSGDAALVGFQVKGKSDAQIVDQEVFMEDVIVGVRMVITYEVRRTDEGTRITRTIETDLPSGILGSLLSVALRAKLRKMQKQLLKDLAAQAEAEA
jgi:Polyketide cyclase / dehydrase and lipid transport